MKRYDIMQGHKGRDKTFWNKIGSLFQGDDGKMWMELQALPIGDSEGRVRCQVFEPKPRDEPRSDSNARQDSGSGYQPMDDDVPFGPEVR